ncbi:hypothetical protein ABEB36_004029 [Hypothenemus hampei]|uniref:Protein transport protein Sec24A n=1 Tax=Hypothenemus hampei TaxID=57062 RepID=A0ABD1F201_HYPHA
MAEPNGVTVPKGNLQYQFNGLTSNNSSRGGSPIPRLGPIPSSQLPPSRSIPQSQLPPSRATVAGLTQAVGNLTVSSQSTPNISPTKFSASTPNQVHHPSAVFSENSSPIVPNLMDNVPLKETTQSEVQTRNSEAQQSSNLNILSSSNTMQGPQQQASDYFSQSTPFEVVPSVGNVHQQPVQSNGPFNNRTQIQVQNMPHSRLLQNKQSSSLRNVNPAGSQTQNFPTKSDPSGQASNMQPQFSSAPLTSHVAQQKIAGIQSSALIQAPPQNKLTYSTSPHNFAQYPQTQTSKQSLPHINQKMYSQTLPSASIAAPNAGPNLNQGPPQFNTGLPSQVPPYSQSSTAQPTGPMPSQRFNPQINYNVGPPNLNGPPTSQTIKPPSLNTSRYPSMPASQQLKQQQLTSSQPNPYSQYPPQGGVVQTGFNRLWGAENIDLLQNPNVLPPHKLQPPLANLGQEQLNQVNCSPDVFRSTVTKIPESSSLLQKSRLPLGLLIHPFKDLNYLPVIHCNVIVRCRSCRTYINPFIYFVDSKRWKCNLCFRVNELPEEFQYDPLTKTYGDPSRRPEIKSSTIEYIAPSEYMLRPPQPAVYLFLLDVSRFAVESGYLNVFSSILLEQIRNLPGDARTQIGIIAYDSALHFFSLAEGLNQPHEMTVLDIEDIFLPTPDALLVNLKDRIDLIEDLLKLLPKRFCNTYDGNSALGAALQAAHKMMFSTGGRLTVFQVSLPNFGPGAVTAREDPNQRSTAETVLLNPTNDFYKKLALECSSQQIAVDLFILNSQYVDIATISGISRFSGGSIHHFPLFKLSRPLSVDAFQKCFNRYLTRKIGFEAVMRVRCTRGLTINNFHGNFFVRSTDLLSLPNINPDAAFGMQVAIEENLAENQTVCFQAALLYTSSKGERRIRVHTLCLPIANTLQDVIQSADQQCIIGLLGKMAVDRSMSASLSDAREAFINVAVDVLSAYKFSLNMGNPSSGILAPECLKLLPLYISAILKHPAFRMGTPTRLDDRLKAMMDMKTKPLYLLMQQIYPDLYPIHNLEFEEMVLNEDEEPVSIPPRLHLSSRCLENKGSFLMDCGDHMMIFVCPNVSKEFLTDTLGVSDYNNIGDDMIEIPKLDKTPNKRLHQFINYLNDEKPYNVTLQIVRDNSPNRSQFLEKLIEDRLENSLSYHEFLQHLKTQVK